MEHEKGVWKDWILKQMKKSPRFTKNQNSPNYKYMVNCLILVFIVLEKIRMNEINIREKNKYQSTGLRFIFNSLPHQLFLFRR